MIGRTKNRAASQARRGRRPRRRASEPAVERATPPGFFRPRLVLLVLMVCAITLRVAYFSQVSESAFADMHRAGQTDMHYYHTWADTIANGDWWSAGVAVPQHAWHQEVSEAYFQQHPGLARQLFAAGAGGAVDPSVSLWSQWMRLPQFYQDALYPYLIALTRRAAGADVRWVFGWQLILGVCSTLLIWDLTRRAFGDMTGMVAGAMALLTAPLLYYELILLRESTMVFACLALTWLGHAAFRRDTHLAFLGLGVGLGLAALLKSSLLLFAAGFSLAAIIVYWRQMSALGRRLGALTLGLLLGLAPLMVRNWVVGVPVLSFASSGQLTFVVSNEASTEPRHGNSVNTPALARFLGTTDGGWRSALAAAFRDHSVGSSLRLLREKWNWTWHWYELPNNDNFYLRRQYIPILQWLPITAWFISPLALIGLGVGLGRHRWQQAWSLYLLVVLSLAPLLVFYVIGRFRVVLLAALIPFAALTLVECVDALRRRHISRTLGIIGAAGMLMLWTGRPLESDMQLIRAGDWLLEYSVQHQPRMRSAGERGDFGAAARACDATFTESRWTTDALASGNPEVPPVLADIQMRCAALWDRAGHASLAQQRAIAADTLLRRVR